MPSLFESTFKTRVVPAAERAFGVSIRYQRGVNLSSAFTGTAAAGVYTSLCALPLPGADPAHVIVCIAVNEPGEFDHGTRYMQGGS